MAKIASESREEGEAEYRLRVISFIYIMGVKTGASPIWVKWLQVKKN
jgi:hypothetical protein